ncbi:hypothetical protein JTE90_006561 [Oedothorax gibbosus]|uniref:Protein SDA1 n=1 Tax=Oedothorax gibbosus TaxID=931172 RepID=A0AAV6VLU2_9ARAC|nr:hypothetical protein JTE90_006561 [Oedothorax gibbosus]
MKRESSTSLTYLLLQLQNRIKKDPVSYAEEFHQQHEHYKSLMELYKLNPHDYNENIEDLVMFLAQLSTSFREDLKDFPNELIGILKEYGTVLDTAMRMTICKALILMRNRGFIPPENLITLFFELLRCKDKNLRKYLQVHIIADLKNINAKQKNLKVNTVVQNFMFKMLSGNNDIAAKMSLDIMIELYRKNIWRDAKTVNAIATGCFSKVNKVLVAAHTFFLGVDDEEENKESSDSEDDNTPSVKDVLRANQVNKKSKKRMKALKRAKQVVQKSKKAKNKDSFDFSAIHLLHDPQGMAEKLLHKLSSMNERFEIKMMVMNLISRLIGVHELILLNYYPLLMRYLNPHQRDVTKILMFTAQAAHEQVPPDVMEPLLRTIADNFITERNSAEVMTVGLNAIRELCMRSPYAISQELLQDLVQYQKYKNKNVMMGARSIIQLFRKVNPQMLQRKYRSKPTEAIAESTPLEYGASRAKSYIPGTEVLSIEPTENEDVTVEDEGNESDGSWVDVSHSEDEMPFVEEDEQEDESEEDENEDSDDEEEEMDESSDNEDVDEEKADDNLEKSGEEKSVKTILPSTLIGSKRKKKRKLKPSSKPKKTAISETQKEDQEKAMAVSQSRILSQEDFRRLKVAQLAKEARFAKGKRKAETEINEPVYEKKEIVSLKSIEKLHKKQKTDKEGRIASIMEGREDREKFGTKKNKKSPFASKTNTEQRKNKPFMMVKHKNRAKIKRSFRDKQVSLRNSLLKRKKNR